MIYWFIILVKISYTFINLHFQDSVFFPYHLALSPLELYELSVSRKTVSNMLKILCIVRILNELKLWGPLNQYREL